jgi:HSP20 family molecular chaperone IbpA
MRVSPLLGSVIRIEEHRDDGRYVIRAELPGVDPVRSISVMVADGELKIKAERPERHRDRRHSEFRYGSFSRTVMLPRGAKDETVAATYESGILEINVEVARPVPIGRTVPVKVAGADDARDDETWPP